MMERCRVLPLPGKRGETSRGEPRPKATGNAIGRDTTMVEGPLRQYRHLRQTPAPSLSGADTGPPHEGDTGQGVVLHPTLGPINAILHQSAQWGARAALWAWRARSS